MAKRNNIVQPISPLTVVRGEQVTANYIEQLIPEYRGNLLIEPLPPIWRQSEVEQMLSYFPHYAPQQVLEEDEIRLHLLENAREFFIPQGVHYEIHLSISNMLRRGYIDRNPIMRGAWAGQVAKMSELERRLQRRAFLRSKARGMCIVGLGGVGKSTAVENILYLYPQVITHTSYKGQDLILKQLVWVKLQCPSDGSLKGLCINYLEEVDDILGTNYVNFYSARRRTVDELLIIMARVASNHFQGVIVFDEIQDLSEAKSGGATRMLNFFVQLENTLGIPFILITTPKAKEILCGEFRQARRISEQGDIYWRPMREIMKKEKPEDPSVIDPDWNDFIRAMWKYWYLRKSHQLPQHLLNEPVVKTLYEESKGITALVVTIFFLAQRRAITSGKEDLTVNIIRSVVKDNQYFVNEVLNQLKEQPKTRRGRRRASDLDISAWQWPKSAQHTGGANKASRASSRGCTEQTICRESQDSELSSKKSKKVPKPRVNKRGFEAGDFRAIEIQPESGQSTFDNNCFGSTDEFS